MINYIVAFTSGVVIGGIVLAILELKNISTILNRIERNLRK